MTWTNWSNLNLIRNNKITKTSHKLLNVGKAGGRYTRTHTRTHAHSRISCQWKKGQSQYDRHLFHNNQMDVYLYKQIPKRLCASLSGASSSWPHRCTIILHTNSFTRLWEADTAVIWVWHNCLMSRIHSCTHVQIWSWLMLVFSSRYLSELQECILSPFRRL